MSRPRCPACLHPPSTCLCDLVRPVHSRIELLILQHPLEELQAKNTARLLHLCLAPRSELLVGEQFGPGLLDPARLSAAALLYPGEGGGPWPRGWQPSRLVLLDGTWRKSRKMLALNPALQALPRFSWAGPAVSRYSVRRAQRPDQLSTLEAAALALQELDPGIQGLDDLWRAFDSLVSRLAERRHRG